MKILFSEAKSDYRNYIFSYAIWAFPEPGETPAKIFDHGFLPSTYSLDRFYLCRQIRVNLARFAPSSENRRILRKGKSIDGRLVPRAEFDFNMQRRAFCKTYADARFQPRGMSLERLDTLLASKIVTHVLIFTDTAKNVEIGFVLLYLEEPTMAYYYYAFYDLDYYARNLGMFMMTFAVELLAKLGTAYIYLGTCYSQNALYKFQFVDAEFFNGFTWSKNSKELRFLIERDQTSIEKHLLEDTDYREQFWSSDLQSLVKKSTFLG